jgi:NADPH2:quinone reductase
VVELGAGAARFEVGDRVCALVSGGGYAEYCVVHESNALPRPLGLSLVEAAAVPETFFTVWANLFQRAKLKAGETVLIHGGASGIGTTATMLSKAFGATVAVTVGSEEKGLACLSLGASLAINYHTHDFVEEVNKFTDGKGADVVVDIVAGDYVARNYRAAAMNGRIVQIGVQNGPARNLNLMPMLSKRLTHTGSTLRSRSVAEKAQIARELERQVWPLLEEGKIKPRIFRTFPLEQAADAHALMESGVHVGKIVLTISTMQADSPS